MQGAGAGGRFNSQGTRTWARGRGRAGARGRGGMRAGAGAGAPIYSVSERSEVLALSKELSRIGLRVFHGDLHQFATFPTNPDYKWP